MVEDPCRAVIAHVNGERLGSAYFRKTLHQPPELVRTDPISPVHLNRGRQGLWEGLEGETPKMYTTQPYSVMGTWGRSWLKAVTSFW